MSKRFDAPEVRIIEEKDNFARYECGDLERGYAITIGNALRRVLLSSLSSHRAYAVEIEGVEHEFSTIDGVREDVMTILQAVKNIVFKAEDSTDRFTCKLLETGSKKIYARDFECDHGLEIINPDLYICTLEGNYTKLKMTVYVRHGRGYVKAEVNKSSDAPVGRLFIDSLFSPIVKVTYEVSPKRFDTEVLFLNVETNGSIKPGEALSLATNIFKSHLSCFDKLDYPASSQDIMTQPNTSEGKYVSFSIDELGLSARSYNALKRNGISYINELIKFDREQLLHIGNLGNKSVTEIEQALNQRGFRLADTIKKRG